MTVLHVREQGAVVRKDGERLQVTHRERGTHQQSVLADAPIRDLTQVAIYGNVQVTTQATALLLEHEIDLVFLSLYGKFRGRLTKSGSKFARLRYAQLRFTSDEARSLAVAKAMIDAKLTNQRDLLQEIAADPAYSTGQQLPRAIRRIEEARTAGSRTTNTDSLRGYEGQGAVAYFEAIRALMDPAWNFVGRQYYPAPDRLNALLSFGYALLMKDCSTVIQLVGLDPYLGCFHALEYDRPSLTLDLMEEFRPLVVDRFVLQLVLSGAVTLGDFTVTKRKTRPVELSEALIPKVIETYEEQLGRAIFLERTRTQITLRLALEHQAQLYAWVVTGEQSAYVGISASNSPRA